MRLDVYLATYWPDQSRSTWQKYCLAGYILVNGSIATDPNTRLGEDDEVTINLPTAADYTSETIPIIYEDKDIIVVNKPSGMLTHGKGALNDEFTVADFIKRYYKGNDTTNRSGIIHRLDRDTSGVLVCAKHEVVQKFLQKQFESRKVKKTYLALIEGTPKQPEAIIRLPIDRNPKKPQTFTVNSSGKFAETSYATLASSKGFSLLELKPLTGRTHQLRVHLQYIGCPIVGDRLYGKTSAQRLMLHAKELEVTLPPDRLRTFIAPIPEDFKAACKKVSINYV